MQKRKWTYALPGLCLRDLRLGQKISNEFYKIITETALSDSVGTKKESPPQKKRIWSQRNIHGEITRSFFTDFQSWFDRYGEGRVNIAWFDLQAKLRSLLPRNAIKVNHRCVHVENEDGRVRIDTISNAAIVNNSYAHWELIQANVDTSASSQESQADYHTSFYARLVIAADGINSTIRQILYGSNDCKQWAKPQYSGFVAMTSTVNSVSSSILEELDTNYMQGGRIVTVHNDSDKLAFPKFNLLRLILIRIPNNSVAYMLYAPFDLNSTLNKPLTEVLHAGTQALKNADFPSIFIEPI